MKNDANAKAWPAAPDRRTADFFATTMRLSERKPLKDLAREAISAMLGDKKDGPSLGSGAQAAMVFIEVARDLEGIMDGKQTVLIVRPGMMDGFRFLDEIARIVRECGARELVLFSFERMDRIDSPERASALLQAAVMKEQDPGPDAVETLISSHETRDGKPVVVEVAEVVEKDGARALGTWTLVPWGEPEGGFRGLLAGRPRGAR